MTEPMTPAEFNEVRALAHIYTYRERIYAALAEREKLLERIDNLQTCAHAVCARAAINSYVRNDLKDPEIERRLLELYPFGVMLRELMAKVDALRFPAEEA